MKSGRGRELLDQVLGELLRYAETHFASGERRFAAYGHPQASAHKDEPVAFVATVRAHQAEVVAGKRYVSLTTFNMLHDWLIDHVMNVDMAYTPCFAARQVR